VPSDLLIVACGLIALWWVWWIPGEMSRVRDRAAAKGADADRFDRRMTPTLRIVRPVVAVAGLATLVVGVIDLVT
jgi:hypothetical protein